MGRGLHPVTSGHGDCDPFQALGVLDRRLLDHSRSWAKCSLHDCQSYRLGPDDGAPDRLGKCLRYVHDVGLRLFWAGADPLQVAPHL